MIEGKAIDAFGFDITMWKKLLNFMYNESLC